MILLKWQDKKDLLFLSRICEDNITVIEQKNVKNTKPEVNVDYNKKIDISDGVIVAYSTARKRLKKYYKKIFLCLLKIVYFNFFFLCKNELNASKFITFLLCSQYFFFFINKKSKNISVCL